MSGSQQLILGEGAGGGAANYIEDVFSTWLYTGTGVSQTITNGIDLSTKGGLVWMKSRTSAYIHCLFDTARGNNVLLKTNSGGPQDSGYSSSFSFLSNGFSVNGSTDFNASGDNEVSWTFRKQPKFFDVVTYTGNGSTQAISHSLGSVPGCIIIKSTSSGSNWVVYHRSLGEDFFLKLNLTDSSQYSTTVFDITAPTSTNFTVGSNSLVNTNGATYVAYLFAHNAGGFGLTGTDNVISCGSYTGNGSTTGPTITLGYEPQWVMVKRATVSTGSWEIYDSMRGFTMGNDAVLRADTSGAEFSTINRINPTATGFQLADSDGDVNANGSVYIYIAIRRGPMKTPTTGTSVFDPEAYTGTSATRTITSGFPVDLSVSKIRSQGYPGGWFDRLRGALQVIRSSSTDAEATSANSLTGFDSMTGVILGSDPSGRINTSPDTYAMWNFRRAPGFFDVVCYTGTGSATTVTHNLGVAPELMIVKIRSGYTPGGDASGNWGVYAAPLGNTSRLAVNLTSAATTGTGVWSSTSPTSSVFSVSGDDLVNKSASPYVAYLFASCPGVSKVGSYVGNGTTDRVIDCGFTSSARFILLKKTSTTSDWYVYDTARGISTGGESSLSLNTTAAESGSADVIDPASSGFSVGTSGSDFFNESGVSYIFLAIA
jgi:hypothetical protein